LILVSGSSSGQTATPSAVPTPSRFQKIIDGGGIGVGNLLVTPPRLVLEGNVRNAHFTLINTGPSPALFRVSIVHMKWNEQGQFVAVTEPGDEEKLAESLFRFSPRQVLLDPQMGQTVRIQVRVPSGLPHGEYHVHLNFQGVPMTSSGPADVPKPSAVPEAPPVAAPAPVPPGPEESGLRISLRALFGINIPVFFRYGSLPLTVTLTRLELLPPTATEPARLSLRINRDGERSCTGSFTVTWIPRTGAQRVVGSSKWVGVWAGSPSLDYAVPLEQAGPDPLNGGLLQVTYVDADKPNGRLLAQATLALP
jgi:hypothetical protein